MKIEPCNTMIRNLVLEKSFSLNSFKKKLPNQSVSKKMTYLDLMSLHQYVDSKRLEANIDLKDIEKLYKKDGINFVSSSLNYFVKTYNCPKEIKPKVFYNTKIDAPMSYSPMANEMYINPTKVTGWNYNKTLVSMRHEFRHFQQTVDMLRCEGLAKKAIRFHAIMAATEERLNNMYKLHKQQNPNKEFDTIEVYCDCFNYIYENPNDKIYKSKLRKFSKMSETAINKMGWIKKDTPEAERAQKLYLDLKEQVYHPSGVTGTNVINYQTSYSEYDAYLAQTVFKNNISGNKKCLFAQLKELNKSFLDLYSSDKSVSRYVAQGFKNKMRENPDTTISLLHFGE